MKSLGIMALSISICTEIFFLIKTLFLEVLVFVMNFRLIISFFFFFFENFQKFESYFFGEFWCSVRLGPYTFINLNLIIIFFRILMSNEIGFIYYVKNFNLSLFLLDSIFVAISRLIFQVFGSSSIWLSKRLSFFIVMWGFWVNFDMKDVRSYLFSIFGRV